MILPFTITMHLQGSSEMNHTSNGFNIEVFFIRRKCWGYISSYNGMVICKGTSKLFDDAFSRAIIGK